MNYNNTIIQWNCRGFQANYDEVGLLAQDFNPVAFCLQETYIKEAESDKIDFPHFKGYHSYSPNTEKATGGSSVFVRNGTLHSPVKLHTNLQAVAVRLTLHITLTLCSIYIPPSSALQLTDLQNLVDQLPQPFLLLGDFNGHNPLWGCAHIDAKGKIIEDLLSDSNSCILNDGSNTYLHPATGTYSAIDLSIADPDITNDFTWSVHDDLSGSDHFPIILESDIPAADASIPKWNFKKADWSKFQTICSGQITANMFENVSDPIQVFSDILTNVANACIPKTSAVPRIHKPWYGDEYKQARKARKKAERAFNKSPTHANLQHLRIFRAKARRTAKQCRRKSWRNYVSKINSRTPLNKVWNMIRKIKGKRSKSNIQHLKVNDALLTSGKDISNTIADTISKNSSSSNYVPEFQKFQKEQEKKNISFKSDNSEDYNEIFSFDELKLALNNANNTACGPDDIHYQLLQNLPESCLTVLLDIFNKIWQDDQFPPSWHQATVIPIPKPGKDHTDPSNYRPIALTSCVCKTMERMINNRLVYFLESNNILTDIQCGFRRNRSTLDHLVRLESFVRNAFINKQHAVSIFFDLEKAYDTTWKYGILKDLHYMGLKGHLPNFIEKFLNNRQFKVRIGSTFSDTFDQEEGVPQGSILSVTLFSIKINSLAKVLNENIDGSLFVDDFNISCRGSNMNTIERQLQLCLNKIHKWSLENGFKFSKTKTCCIHFCNKRKMHNDPQLFLNGTPIKVVKENKFLGVIFDSKLSFIPHIKSLKAKCSKALDILKVISSTDWGGDQETLLYLYRSLIRSKLDYGSIIYGSARESYLKDLDQIHHQGLRLCLGAFRTSPVESLYVEANEPPLSIRRTKLSLQYTIKLNSNPSNPAFDCVFSPPYEAKFLKKPNAIPPFGIRIKPHLSKANIDLSLISDYKLPRDSPWLLDKPVVDLSLSTFKKSETSPLVFQEEFALLKDKYSKYTAIYTDGSRSDSGVTAAAVTSSETLSVRLPHNSSIFTAEAKAMLIALGYISKRCSAKHNKFIIFSDSLSCLTAIRNFKTDHPLILEILELHSQISLAETHYIDIIFCWLPSHIGIAGNTKADSAARSALNKIISKDTVPYTDFKSLIREYITSEWESRWAKQDNNKLHAIQPNLVSAPLTQYKRKECVVLRRCRMGHTYLTHSFLLKGEDPPQCISCQCPLTIQHILLECVEFALVRDTFYSVSSMFDLFNRVSGHNLLEFLREINLFHKI